MFALSAQYIGDLQYNTTLLSITFLVSHNRMQVMLPGCQRSTRALALALPSGPLSHAGPLSAQALMSAHPAFRNARIVCQ